MQQGSHCNRSPMTLLVAAARLAKNGRMAKYPQQSPRLSADFNGLFGDLLCLAHSDVCPDENGVEVLLQENMIATAYEEDEDVDGRRDDLVATGVVQRSPEWLSCRGSVWCLKIDENGVRHQSQIE